MMACWSRTTAWGSLVLALPLLTSAGCATVKVEWQQPSWPWMDGPRKGEVAQVIAIWADGLVAERDPSQGSQAGAPNIGLGFAGRVYLFGPEAGETLAADGELVIYEYDAAQPQTGQPSPRELWKVNSQTLSTILKKDPLGWGYTLWLPWTTYQANVEKVTLVAQYKPAKGREVWSEPIQIKVRGEKGLHGTSRMELTASVKGSAGK